MSTTQTVPQGKDTAIAGELYMARSGTYGPTRAIGEPRAAWTG